MFLFPLMIVLLIEPLQASARLSCQLNISFGGQMLFRASLVMQNVIKSRGTVQGLLIATC